MAVESSSKSSLRIGAVEAEPGTTVYGTLPALEFADGTKVDFPLVLIAGAEPGPRVFVGAGVHGDEVTGIEAVHRLIKAVDPAALSGDIVCIPIQNPPAVAMQHRYAMQLFGKSPMDQLPGDPWMCFPGNPEGNTVQRMASTLFEVMATADAVLDLHTPTTGGRYLSFIFVPPKSLGSVAEKAMELAEAFSPYFILAADSGPYVMPTAPHMILAERGIPAFGFEVGEGGLLEEDLADDVVRGMLNVLRSLGMLDGELERDGTPLMVSSFTEVRCSRGGFLHQARALGDVVAKGDLLSTITDRYGRVAEEVVAPHDGPLLRATTFATVASGERVAQLGVVA